MISKHIFTSDVVSGKAFWLNNLQSTGNLVTANGNFTITNDATILGDLTVKGSTTTIDTVTLTVDDNNIELGSIDNPTDSTANGGGITLKGSTDKTFNWSSDANAWESNVGLNVLGGNLGIGTDDPKVIHHISTANDSANYAVSRFTADIQQFDVGVGGSTAALTELRNKFYIFDSTDSIPRLVIDGGGKVGIGTTAPQALFNVPQGSSTIGGNDLTKASILIGNATEGIGIDDNEIIKKGGNIVIGAADANARIEFRTNQQERLVVSNTDTTVSHDLIVAGNLTVNGTTSTINSTTVTVDDKNIELGSVASPTNDTANGGGITLKGATDKTISWSKATTSWDVSENLGVADGKYVFTDRVRARDAAGLLLQDDSGNGITINDGGNTSVSHAFAVGGNTTIGGNTSIVGTTYLGGAATFNDNVTINAAKTLQAGNITVADNKYITTDKIVARDAGGLLLQDDGGNGITIANGGNVSTSNNLTVAGSSTFNDNVTIASNKTLNVGGDVNIGGATTFEGATVFQQNVVISGDFNVTSETPMSLEQGSMEIQTLTTAPTTTTNQIYNYNTNLYWDGKLVLNSNNVTVTEAGNLAVGQDLLTAGNATIVGTTEMNGVTYHNNTAYFYSDVYMDANDTLYAGTIRAKGDVIAFTTSDERLKNNISNISDPLNKIEQINGVNFEWSNEQSNYEGKDVGVIAQDIEKVIPEAVSEREDGYLAVKYEKIIPLLIEAIKEQQKEIEILKSKIK